MILIEGVHTMKADILQSLNDRYDGVEEEDVLAVATILDPQFKDKFFSSAEAKATARQLLITKTSELSCDDVTQVPSPKRKRNDNKILKCFSEIFEESGACVAGDIGDIGDTEVDQYLKYNFIALILIYGGKTIHTISHNFQSWRESIWLHLLLQ